MLLLVLLDDNDGANDDNVVVNDDVPVCCIEFEKANVSLSHRSNVHFNGIIPISSQRRSNIVLFPHPEQPPSARTRGRKSVMSIKHAGVIGIMV
jgi:hypothetical protein